MPPNEIENEKENGASAPPTVQEVDDDRVEDEEKEKE